MEAKVQIFGDIGTAVTLQRVASQIPSGATSVAMEVSTRGGDVDAGVAIYEYLRGLNIPISAKVVGYCYSIGTIILLAADTRTRTPGAAIMIHNPWAQPQGDAKALREFAEYLEKKQEQMLAIYAERLRLLPADISAIMAENRDMTDDEIARSGIVSAEPAPMRAVAYFHPQQSKDMTENDRSWLKAQLDAVASIFKKHGVEPERQAVALVKDGKELTAYLAEGVAFAQATGAELMPAGKYLQGAKAMEVSEDGQLSDATDYPALLAALEAERDEATQKVKEMEADLAELKGKVGAMASFLSKIDNAPSRGHGDPAPPVSASVSVDWAAVTAKAAEVYTSKK